MLLVCRRYLLHKSIQSHKILSCTVGRRIENSCIGSAVKQYKTTTQSHITANSTLYNTMSTTTHNNNTPQPKVIFVLGGPGAGKGTQCSNIVNNYQYVHLSAGDLLREERQNPNSTHGQLIDEYIRNGQIVPVEITVNLLKNAMQHHIQHNNKHLFLIDGFPRNQDNLDGWYRVIKDFAQIQNVLFFDCSEHTMEQRLLQRGQTSGRTDDNIDSIKKRFVTYQDSTRPIIDYFDNLHLVHKINADQSVDKVFHDVKHIMDDLVKNEKN